LHKIQVKGCKVVGLDSRKLPTVDVQHDLEQTPLPFKDNSFDIVFSYGVLEHINNLPELVKEVYRILKNGGKFISFVPHFSTITAVCDADHIRFFSSQSFYTFDKDNEFNYFETNFKVKTRILFHTFLKPFEPIFNYGIFKKLYEGTVLRNIIPCFLIFIEMTKEE